jgi:hypothetical protein
MPNLIEIIKMAAVDAVKASNPAAIVFGTVTRISPLKVNIEQRLTLDESHLVLTRNVTDYKTKISFDNPAIKNIVKSYSMDDVPGSNYKLTFEEVVKNEITVYNGLVVGEEVILLQVQGGQKYIILDRIR